MAIIYNKIVESNVEPSPNDLWLKDGKLKHYKGGWKDISSITQENDKQPNYLYLPDIGIDVTIDYFSPFGSLSELGLSDYQRQQLTNAEYIKFKDLVVTTDTNNSYPVKSPILKRVSTSEESIIFESDVQTLLIGNNSTQSLSGYGVYQFTAYFSDDYVDECQMFITSLGQANNTLLRLDNSKLTDIINFAGPIASEELEDGNVSFEKVSLYGNPYYIGKVKGLGSAAYKNVEEIVELVKQALNS